MELIKETADKISLAIEEKLKEIKPEQEASKVSEQRWCCPCFAFL